jgi:hypothetical protein
LLREAGVNTPVRPWLQAFSLKSPSFGPKYIADEAKSAESAGGVGWLLWHPGGDYGAAWPAFPKLAAAGGSTARVK